MAADDRERSGAQMREAAFLVMLQAWLLQKRLVDEQPLLVASS